MGFFKAIGKGLLYIILSPIIITLFAIFFVYSVMVFIVEAIIACIKFFSGSKLTIKTKEDEELQALIDQKNQESLQSNTTNQTTNQTINNYFVHPAFFNQDGMNNYPNLQQNAPQEINMTNEKYIEINSDIENKTNNEINEGKVNENE